MQIPYIQDRICKCKRSDCTLLSGNTHSCNSDFTDLCQYAAILITMFEPEAGNLKHILWYSDHISRLDCDNLHKLGLLYKPFTNVGERRDNTTITTAAYSLPGLAIMKVRYLLLGFASMNGNTAKGFGPEGRNISKKSTGFWIGIRAEVQCWTNFVSLQKEWTENDRIKDKNETKRSHDEVRSGQMYNERCSTKFGESGEWQDNSFNVNHRNFLH